MKERKSREHQANTREWTSLDGLAGVRVNVEAEVEGGSVSARLACADRTFRFINHHLLRHTARFHIGTISPSCED